MTKHSVCFFGDEVLLGQCEAGDGGWAHRLARAERDNGHKLDPHIVAAKGNTTASIAETWESEARARLTGLPTSAILFCFGLHDQAMHNRDVLLPMQKTLYHAEEILRRASEWRTVFWVGPPPVARSGALVQGRGKGTLHYDPLRIQALSQGFADIAADCGVPYLDLCGLLQVQPHYMQSLRAGHGVLPDPVGQDLISRNIQAWRVWRTWLDQGISPNFCKIA